MPSSERLTSLAVVRQENVAPSIGLATDRHLLATLGKALRPRPGVLRIYSFPGDVLAAGRWHLAPPAAADAGEAFVRRMTGGRALALGEGYLGVSLLLPHRSALAAETDDEGRLVFEMILAVDRPLGAVAQLLDRWDKGGIIKADLLALEAGTSLREEIGETLAFNDLAALVSEAFAQQYGVALEDAPLSALEEQAVAALAQRESRTWTNMRVLRQELPLAGSSGIQTGVLEVHFALEQERFVKEIQLAGDFIANSPAIAALEYGLRLCPAEWTAITRVVDGVFVDPANYLLGVGTLRAVADTIVKGLPS